MSLATSQKAKRAAPCVLIVDDEPQLVEAVSDIAAGRLKCRSLWAGTLSQARMILSNEPVDLVIIDLNLPDGPGTNLLPILHELRPNAQAIIITGQPSVAGVVSAMRKGVLDVIPKPFSASVLEERIRCALESQAETEHGRRRMKTLRRAVKRLNEARKMVSKKVDLLCNDLVGAYTDLSKQMETVRIQEGYRQFIGQTQDLEQLLCHTMDWLMRQLGYCNVGIWLAADDTSYNLGAYMKYSIPGDAALTDAVERNLVKLVARKGFVHASGPEANTMLTVAELQHLAGQDLLGINSTYLGDTLAVIVLFRDAKTPFNDDDSAALKLISPLFALSLTRAVRGGGEEAEGEAADPDTSARGATDDPADSDSSSAKKPHKDPADWWKRGDEPPY